MSSEAYFFLQNQPYSSYVGLKLPIYPLWTWSFFAVENIFPSLLQLER